MKKSTLAVLLSLGFLASSASAVTLTLSAGLPAQGIVVQTAFSSVQGYQFGPTEQFYWQFGNYNVGTSTWTPVGTAPILVTGNGTSVTSMELKGSTSPISPAALEGLRMQVFIGIAPTIAASGEGWAILDTTASGITFPSPITGTGTRTFAATLASNLTIVARGSTSNGFISTPPPQEGSPLATVANAGFNLVPEPSTAALGLLAGLGLMVRRRRA